MESAPRINQILLIPGAGWSSDDGTYTRGHAVPSIAEVDIVDICLRSVVDIFEEYGVRYSVLPTRSQPGVKTSERGRHCDPHTLLVDLSIAWFARPRTTNESFVCFHDRHGESVAQIVCDALSDWGNCSAFGHRVCVPKLSEKHPAIVHEGCLGVHIEPFAINGPRGAEYLPRLNELGRDLGHALTEWMVTRGANRASAPAWYKQEEPQPEAIVAR